MKKIILVLSLVLALGLGSMFVYAETNTLTKEETQANIWHDERMEYRREELKNALDNKEITEEDYKSWLEHFNDMEEFHEENGFFNGRGFGNGCHSGGRGVKGFGGMMRNGSGGGMMRNGGSGWNNN